ncbi:MAG TPA: outer membrane beta-barrel protein, partial [Niastella sp.]
ESPGYIDTLRGTYASVQGQGTGQVYYSQKKRYRFHYIEVPVLLNWQINKGRRLPPIVFEGGVSIGRMFSADALHYEGVKGVYYEDNSLFNKTQFNFVTGLSVGLMQKSKHPIWIGPDLRYSLNGLVKKDISKGQYIWSTGISFKMLLGRL